MEKILVFEMFFKFNNYFFSTGTPTANNLNDVIPVTHFEDFKYRYSKWYSPNKLDDSMSVTHFPGLQGPALELQANSMVVNRIRTSRISTLVFLGKRHLHVLLLKIMMMMPKLVLN